MNMMKTRLINRTYDPASAARLVSEGYSRPLAQVLAGRHIVSRGDMDTGLKGLLSPAVLPHAGEAAEMLADALEKQLSITIVGDYDCDGATATTVAYRGLSSLGFKKERLSWFIPNRVDMGYGLSPAVVDAVCQKFGRPDIILTVDNGAASFEGVRRASECGIRVLVTDHHLTGDELPAAECIVNPNGPDGQTAPKNLAGVGVILYVLIALRAELRRRGIFTRETQPSIAPLLDLVALGTIADVVPLDRNNRILVSQGLARLKNGCGTPGLAALYSIATQGKNQIDSVSVRDLGFTLAPRINAAGRLDSMDRGIDCLLSEPADAFRCAEVLESLNTERKALEREMQEEAFSQLEEVPKEHLSVVLFNPDWHQGLVGLIANRVKERVHRPCIAFADIGNGILKGSGRSIPGIHLRDALSRIDSMHPGVLVTYGGHALAAGLSIRSDRFGEFVSAFEKTTRECATPEIMQEEILVDGALSPEEISFDLIHEIDSVIWGQAFEAPLFANRFRVVRQTPLRGGEHLKAMVETAGHMFEAVFFRHSSQLPEEVKLAYRPEINSWMGRTTVQLTIEHAEE